MIEWIYFDTNFFYKLVEDELNRSILDEFVYTIKNRRIRLYYTPITFVEVAKHINKGEAGKFGYYKNILKKIKEWCGDNIREYPDQALAKSLQLPERRTNDINDLNRFRDMILCYDSYKMLKNDYNFAIFKKFIVTMLKSKNGWCKYLQVHINALNPYYFKRLNDGKVPRITGKKIREDLIKELESDEFKIICVDATLKKATDLNERCFIGQPSIKSIEKIYDKYIGYFSAYKSISEKIINNGYSVSKNRNDFEDVHLLIYLGYGQHVRLISYDDRLKSKIKGCKQECQIITIEGILHP